jgi:hypothetical protein
MILYVVCVPSKVFPDNKNQLLAVKGINIVIVMDPGLNISGMTTCFEIKISQGKFSRNMLSKLDSYDRS